ncbi:MAG: acetolactate synthase large subunit [Acidimicrobiales bacterium]
MNGARALLSTLGANHVTICFANPGTSEMHFVAALDESPEMRAVLCLFEGVATGAADGYARVTGQPAATLLHLGPGLANGWANLHNARRAHTPIVNIVGDHATYHAIHDAPLQSNIESLAEPLEGWFRRSVDANALATDVADAVAASHGPPGRIATLVVPADVSWNEVHEPSSWPIASEPPRADVGDEELSLAEHVLRTRRTVVLLGGSLTRHHLDLAHRIGAATSARVMTETFPTIVEGGGTERLNYLSEFALEQLKDAETVILAGAREPVGFFAYPNVASRLVPDGTEIIDLVAPGGDVGPALEALADALNAPPLARSLQEPPPAPSGVLNAHSLAVALVATLPEGVIIADESNTSGVHLPSMLGVAPPHHWMTLTGGSIGFGLPVALGAAVASKGRVLALESDGSMMYTPQALWTMAREGLDVTVVGLANRSYAILNFELARVGAHADGEASARLLDIDNPTLDLASLATALGIPSVRATTAEELVTALQRSYATPGPTFIEAVLPKRFG